MAAESNLEEKHQPEIDIPHEYLCPLSKDIMRDPVILLDDGFTYDRKSIETYLRVPGSRSPLTGLPLVQRRVEENINLNRAIQHFRAQYPDLTHSRRIAPVVDDTYVAEMVARQQEEEEQQKQRRRTPFFAYLQHVEAYLQKRQLLRQHVGANNYDVFISYAWQNQAEKELKELKKKKGFPSNPEEQQKSEELLQSLEAHRKLQGFLMCLHDDLQRAGLNVFFDCKDMDREMAAVMKESVAQSGIILSICKPFLQQAIKDRPQGNIALEVNCAVERAAQQPEALLPLLCEGEWDEALPLPMQGKARLNEHPCQDARQVFTAFDHHKPFSPLYMDWIASHLIPRIVRNLGIQPDDLLLSSMTQLFHSQMQHAQLSPYTTPYEQFEHNYPSSSAEQRTETGLQAFEFTLRRLAELTKSHRIKIQAEDSKDEETPEQQILLISQPQADRAFTAWRSQFTRHLKLAGFTVTRWWGNGDFPEQAPRAVIVLCTPEFKQILETDLAQQENKWWQRSTGWSQLRRHLTQRGVVCYPVIYQGNYATAVPVSSKDYKGLWESDKKFLVRHSTEGGSLEVSQQHYYEFMMGIHPEGLLRDLLRYKDNDRCYNFLYENLQMMLAGWGTQLLLNEAEKQHPREDAKKLYEIGRKHADRGQFQIAHDFFQRSAAQHYPPAYLWLYLLYQENRVTKNSEQELHWKNLASAQFAWFEKEGSTEFTWFQKEENTKIAEAKFNLGLCYEHGIGVEKSFKEASRYYRLAADQRHAAAQTKLGVCYQNGTGVDKNPAEAIRLYRLAADQRHATAQNNLGKCYYDGIGVDKNPVEAIRLYRLAAEQGDADAQRKLGVSYYNGIGVEKDLKEAVRWYRLAAYQGHATAQTWLGFFYYNGAGVDKDPIEAVRWYRLAADQGEAAAQTNLGMCYHNGTGLAKDLIEAVRWYRLAADQGGAAAQNWLGFFYKNGIGVAKDLKEAIHWYSLAAAQKSKGAKAALEVCQCHFAAEQGDADAQYNLGTRYDNGTGGEQDPVKAVQWYRLAADQGHAKAQVKLGICYEYGKGVDKNLEEAVRWYRLAAEQGNATAQYYMGICYRDNIGVDKNLKKAIHWYSLAAEQKLKGAKEALEVCQCHFAAEQGDADAQYNLGTRYDNGTGGEQDPVKAVQWYRLAADQGHAEAQNNLGVCYDNGTGVDKDPKEAICLYRLAADQGNMYAQSNLGVCYENGTGIDKDLKQAVHWYSLAAAQKYKGAKEALELCQCHFAAEQGDADAQYNLGIRYANGTAVKKDLKEAVRCYRLAANQGHAKAQVKLGICYEYGKGVDKNLEEAVRWYRLAAEQGNATAQYYMGICYRDNIGVDKNLKQAVRWYSLAAEQKYRPAKQALELKVYKHYLAATQGHAAAQIGLGICYEYGEGIDKNLEEAMRWYRLAAEQYYDGAQEALRLCQHRLAREGSADAQFDLAVRYAHGTGGEQDPVKAVQWYRLAADQGHAEAQVKLGICYEYGKGVDKNLEEAMRWYRLAAEQGNATAQYYMGICYRDSIGVVKNLKEAVQWYRLAADQGHAEAKRDLDRLLQESPELAVLLKALEQAEKQPASPLAAATNPELSSAALRAYPGTLLNQEQQRMRAAAAVKEEEKNVAANEQVEQDHSIALEL